MNTLSFSLAVKNTRLHFFSKTRVLHWGGRKRERFHAGGEWTSSPAQEPHVLLFCAPGRSLASRGVWAWGWGGQRGQQVPPTHPPAHCRDPTSLLQEYRLPFPPRPGRVGDAVMGARRGVRRWFQRCSNRRGVSSGRIAPPIADCGATSGTGRGSSPTNLKERKEG